MTTRRYGDDEVREILRLATTGSPGDRLLAAESGGLTLDELQHIGQEAGIEPARVALAAASLDARGKPAPVQRAFGLAIGLSRVVDLPRVPTDREWERLISEFRTTFGVQGRATSSGGLREWSYGDLHIGVEPTEHGEQLRLTTRNGAAMAFNALSIVTGGMSLLIGAVATAAGKPGKALVVFGTFGGIALASFAANMLRSPRWARDTGRQIDAIAEHAVRLLSNSQVDPPHADE